MLSAQETVICSDMVWRDMRGEEIWCNGGHMIQLGDTFYRVGYETRPRMGFRKIKLYASANLADWKSENNILREEGPLTILGWAGRPGLLHNRITKMDVVIFEADYLDIEKKVCEGFEMEDRHEDRALGNHCPRRLRRPGAVWRRVNYCQCHTRPRTID